MSTEDSTPATREEEKAKPGPDPTNAKPAGDRAVTLQPGSYTVKVLGAADSKAGATDAKAEDQKAKAEPERPAGPPWYRRPLPVGLLVLALAVILVAGILIWRHTRDHVSTDDAYIDGIPQLVSPQVAGRVELVLVDDNQDVKAGQLLVELDASDYQTKVDQARATLAQAEAQLAEAQAQQTVYDAQVQESKASLATAEANATNAANQLGRYQRLKAVDGGAVSDQQLDSATAAAAGTAAQLNAAHSAVAAAEAQLGYSGSMITAGRAGIQSADAQLAQADLTLSYTRVIARIDGRVANKNVTGGTVVAAGTPLMAVVPQNVYVTANLKETQLDHIKRGQAVKITVDAYPDLKLTGKVDSVEPASGQTFSALPAQNATGNWVKVVQRVEVKVVFDQVPDDPNRRLAPGMSVEIRVMVR
jgi:membrane fusion protein (multidrug efflux system)